MALVLAGVAAFDIAPVLLRSAAIAAGLVAATLHLRLMTTALATGLRRHLGRSFTLARIAWGSLVASLALALGFGLGCAKAHPSPPASAHHGEASFRVLAEAELADGGPDLSAVTITVIHPFAENKAPSYPDGALRAGCGDGLVPVRVHVGIDGRVSAIQRIPVRPVPGDACHGELETAVRQILGTWQFVPAYRVRKPAAETPGNETATAWEPLGLDLDYEFVFAVVDGKGAVRSKQ
jgi:hypothetical protein